MHFKHDSYVKIWYMLLKPVLALAPDLVAVGVLVENDMQDLLSNIHRTQFAQIEV